jgi:hypothetical protein
MQLEHHFSWLRELMIPVVFVLLGAALGFTASQINDWLKAKRDKKAFLRAIGMELDALRVQLNEWDSEVKSSLESVSGGSPTGPQYSATLQTTVFSSQLGKLRDVDDALLADVILFYAELGTLDQSIKIVNDTSAEFTRTPVTDWLETFDVSGPRPGTKESIRPRLLSSLSVLQKKISTTRDKLKKLRAKLPAATNAKDQ